MTKLMFKFIFLSLLFFTVNNSFATTLVLSDIDDTIKDTEVLHKKALAKKMGNLKLPFLGMSSLYHKIISELKASGEVVHMVYLSNAPEKGFGKRHRRFLRLNNFPEGNAYLRRNVLDNNHKYNSIDHLLKTLKPERVIFLGDNGESDAKIYQDAYLKLFNKYGVRNSHVFIRHAYPSYDEGKFIYDNQISFLNAADIALILYRDNLLGLDSTREILLENLVINADLAQTLPLIPNWIDCREFYDENQSSFHLLNENPDFLLKKEKIIDLFTQSLEALTNRCDKSSVFNNLDRDDHGDESNN